MVLIQQEDRIYGQIRQNGRVFDIQYLENGYATLIEYGMEKLNQMNCAAEEDNHTMEVIGSDGAKKSDGARHGPSDISAARASGSSSASPLVRVLCLFTPAAKATGTNLENLANTARAQWSTAQRKSAVRTNLQIVGVKALNFIENIRDQSDNEIDIQEDVKGLRNDLTAQKLRDQFEADIVMLFTNGDYPNIGGIVPEIGPLEDDAYGIVQVANATSTMTWVHEIGHLFGARHQLSQDNTPDDAHGHGWQTGVLWWVKRYGSIMRTQAANRSRVLHFSNPNKKHAGKATGENGKSFNARVINTNGRQVCDFRYTRPDVVVKIYGGSGLANDGDRLSFSSSVTNASNPITYRWQANTGRGYYNVGFSHSLSLIMPTDRDLYVRLVVTDKEGRTDTDVGFVRNSHLDGGGGNGGSRNGGGRESGGGGRPCTACPDSIVFDLSTEEVQTEILDDTPFLLYPNPSSDFIEIAFRDNLSDFENAQIINLSGAVKSEFY